MRKQLTVVVLGVMAGALVAAAQSEFHYLGPNGPAFWGQLDPAWAACGNGHEQSPIDFGKLTLLTQLHRRPVPIDYESSTGQIFNNGHTIEVETEGHSELT